MVGRRRRFGATRSFGRSRKPSWGKKKVGIRVFVFDARAALAQADYCDWIVREIKGAPKDNLDKPESSSPRLRKWFGDMRRSFPLIGDADPDDANGTEYCFYWNVIDVIFAGSDDGAIAQVRLAISDLRRSRLGNRIPGERSGIRDVP